MDVMPYNFIPLEAHKKQVKPRNLEDQSLLEGRIHCTLTIDSPVFIPNTTGDAFFSLEDQKIREFYSRKIYTRKPDINDGSPQHPLIPGSSIRGALRSVYEAATNSCMSVLGDKYILSTRQPFARQPGILKKTDAGYVLYQAVRYKTELADKDEKGRYIFNPKTTEHFRTGDSVRFRTEIRRINNTTQLWVNRNTIQGCPHDAPHEQGWFYGVVLAGEPGADKESDAIFVLEGQPAPVSDADIELLKSVLALYANPKRNKHMKRGHTGYKGFDLKKAEKSLPVYILELNAETNRQEDTRYYLSPAAISKNVYEKTLNSLTQALGYAPCTGNADEDGNHDLCPACSLFGMVGKNGRAYGSRIRVTDALPCPHTEIQYGAFRTIAPQMEPNVSATEMYTRPPYEEEPGSEKGWTFDYMTNDGIHLIPLSPNEPMLRGRKFYWHFAAQTFCENSRYDAHGNPVITKRFTPQIRPIEQGTFEFDIYLDGVTEDELKQLIALIRLPDDEGFTGRHKIGAAKALGYGSVKMDVSKVEIRTLQKQGGVVAYVLEDRTSKYEKLTCFTGSCAVFNMKGRDDLQSLRAMLNAQSLNQDEIAVHYLPLSAYRQNRNVMGKLVILDANLLPTVLAVMAQLASAEQPNEVQEIEIQQYTEEDMKPVLDDDEYEFLGKGLTSKYSRHR